MEEALTFGLNCVADRTIQENDAVMFDIDDTLLRTDGSIIKEMVYLFQTCKSLGYKMIVITARPPSEENIDITKKQLHSNGIRPDVLFFADPDRKTTAKEQLKLHFVLSVGDMYTDLGGSDYSIKLPDRRDNNVYTKGYLSNP
jgi:predicted HAD superfamily phosphohydrolase YqeG